jgi:hypothetical protein
MQTLLAGDPGAKLHRWRAHTYTVVAAFNTETKEVWGQRILDEWRIAVAAMEISKQLGRMSIDDQLRCLENFQHCRRPAW